MRALCRGWIGSVLWASFLSVAQSAERPFQHFLTEHLGFGQADLLKLADREILVREVASDEKREVAILGAVRIEARGDFFYRKFRDIVNFKKSYAVPEIGVFSRPPRIEDLAGLTLPEDDLKDLRECRVGNCRVRLSRRAIERVQTTVDPPADDWEARITHLLKQMMVEYVLAYLEGGNASLAEYHDKERRVSLRQDFEDILKDSSALFEGAPEPVEYLRNFPNGRLPNVEEFVYWSKEEFGLKPVISVTHVTLYQRKVGNCRQTLIASKQIYASHYFDSSLGLTGLLEEEDATGAPVRYLAYFNRSRTSDLAGTFSGLRRSIVGKRLRKGMEENLLYTRARLEALYRAETFGQ